MKVENDVEVENNVRRYWGPHIGIVEEIMTSSKTTTEVVKEIHADTFPGGPSVQKLWEPHQTCQGKINNDNKKLRIIKIEFVSVMVVAVANITLMYDAVDYDNGL